MGTRPLPEGFAADGLRRLEGLEGCVGARSVYVCPSPGGREGHGAPGAAAYLRQPVTGCLRFPAVAPRRPSALVAD